MVRMDGLVFKALDLDQKVWDQTSGFTKGDKQCWEGGNKVPLQGSFASFSSVFCYFYHKCLRGNSRH